MTGDREKCTEEEVEKRSRESERDERREGGTE